MSTERAVATLIEVDPEFILLCEVLYGPEVQAQEVWDDVYGIAKADSNDPHKTLKRIGLAATLIGTGLGIKEIAHVLPAAAPKMVGAIDSAVPSLKTTLKKIPALPPKVRIAGTGAMIGGDMAAAQGLKQPKQPDDSVAKLSLMPVKRLATSIRGGWKKAERTASQTVGVAEQQVRANKIAGGKSVGQALRHPIAGSKAQPIAAAGLGGTALLATDKYRNRPRAYDDVYKAEPEFEAEGEFTKFDEDKRLAFGWASVIKKDGVPVVDRQGDYIEMDELENAAYKYVLNSRIGGDMHKRNGQAAHHVSDLVESFVLTPEKIEKMGLPEDTPHGWWVGFKVHDDDTWDLVKKKGRTGFSIHGSGKRALHELEGF